MNKDLFSALYGSLSALGISYTEVSHAPLMTVSDSKSLRGEISGFHVRNMFLRDKRRRYWLLTVEEDQSVDLKAMKRLLGASGSLSFADSESLWEHLRVVPGAVTPLSVLWDSGGRVDLLLDGGLFADNDAVINVHPLRNDRTLGMRSIDLLRFVRHYHKEPKFIDFTMMDFVELF